MNVVSEGEYTFDGGWEREKFKSIRTFRVPLPLV